MLLGKTEVQEVDNNGLNGPSTVLPNPVSGVPRVRPQHTRGSVKIIIKIIKTDGCRWTRDKIKFKRNSTREKNYFYKAKFKNNIRP